MKQMQRLAWVFCVVSLCAVTAFAQGRPRRGAAAAAASGGDSDTEGQVLRIEKITQIANKAQYELAWEGQNEMKKNIGVNGRKDNVSKDEKEPWHYFEVSYSVPKWGDTKTLKNEKQAYILDEVEITFSLVYDTKTCPKCVEAKNVLKKVEPFGAVKTRYVMFTKTFTYLGITPGREHYAGVVLPPAVPYLYGLPCVFSVEIKYGGVRQGQIATLVSQAADKDAVNFNEFCFEKNPKNPKDKRGKDWWVDGDPEKITVVEGLMKDRSQTPFAIYSPEYYDMVK